VLESSMTAIHLLKHVRTSVVTLRGFLLWQFAGHASAMTTEKQWKVILDLLQCMTAGHFKTPAALNALMKVLKLLKPMARQPAAPAKNCTKLVVGLKVGSTVAEQVQLLLDRNKLGLWRALAFNLEGYSKPVLHQSYHTLKQAC